MTDPPDGDANVAGSSSTPPGRWSTFGRMARLSLKELRETLRDRRTIVTLVLMPLLVYPLLSLTFQRFLLNSLPIPGEEVYLVAVDSIAAQQTVETYLEKGREFLKQQRDREQLYSESLPQKNAPGEKTRGADQGKKTSAGAAGLEELSEPTFRVDIVDDVEDAVTSGEYDLGVRLPSDTDFVGAKKLRARVAFELIYRKGSPLSRKTLLAAERSLDALNNEVRVAQLEQMNVPRHKVPARLSRRMVVGTGSGSPFSLAALVPLVLILMTITGAVYPAIDLTAGERERGTLEMLVAAPVPRIGLLLAKYSAVVLVAVMTATVNLVGMTITIVATGLGPLIFGKAGLSPGTVAAVFGLMLLFAAFFSAVLLVLTSFARSFKEAQAYLIPLMLVSIAPGILSIVPDLELDGLLLVTPLANIVLLARDLFLGQATGVAAVVVMLSTAFFAGAALSVAARIFGTDAILYGSHGTWSDLFRRPSSPASAATVSTVMMTLAFLFPGFILLGQFVMQLESIGGRELSLTGRLMLNGVVSILLFGVVPFLVAVNRSVRLRTGFSLDVPSGWFFPAAILLGCSLFPFVFEVVMWTTELFKSSTVSPTVEKVAGDLAERLRSVPLIVVLAGLALIPAVCEEIFFRGFLLSAFRKSSNKRAAIVTSAVLFGVFHVVVRDGLAIERLLPSTLMGLVLGWVCVRSGSLYPGMLLHACHNGLLLTIAYYQPELAARGFLTTEQSHFPWWWLAGAAAIAGTGFALAWFAGDRESDSESPV